MTLCVRRGCRLLRVFHALVATMRVRHLSTTWQETGRTRAADLRGAGRRGRVLAAIERVRLCWRANLARGAWSVRQARS